MRIGAWLRGLLEFLFPAPKPQRSLDELLAALNRCRGSAFECTPEEMQTLLAARSSGADCQQPGASVDRLRYHEAASRIAIAWGEP